MATHTFYLTDIAATATNGWFGTLQDGGTPPTAANTAGPCQVGKLAIGSFAGAMVAGGTANTVVTTSSTSLIDSKTGPTVGSSQVALGDCFTTPATLTGTFASGNWVFAISMRPTSGSMQGRIRMRVWRSANANGSSATEITTATQVGTTTALMSVTTTTYTSTITWAAPSFSVTSEYLFFQIEFQEQTAAGSAVTAKLNLRVGSETNCVTTDLSTGGGGSPFIFPRSRHYVRR